MKVDYSIYLNEALQIYGSQKKKSITKVAEILHKKHAVKTSFQTFRRGLSDNFKRINAVETAPRKISKRKKSTSKKTDANPFVLSAWNFKTGEMMDIDEYCEFYKLPRNDVKSYKLVSHTGTPFFNILFKENIEISKDLTEDYIANAVKKYIQPIKLPQPKKMESPLVDRLIYTDAHIGMTPNKDGFALYGGKWDEEELLQHLNETVAFIVSEQQGNKLIIDELGDFVDGWDGETVRKGHKLPQNMDNQQMFDVGLKFKVLLIDALVHYYSEIEVHNICEDNHAGAFGYVINAAFKNIVELKYKNVTVVNHRKFINHYFCGDHCFVISHGKDSHALKFGFKPHLDPKQIEKIDQYLKQNGIYKKADYIEFSKGDSHQMLFDYCTSDDFDYMNYPAYSPSSEWVQTNFKKGRSGFVLQHVNPHQNYKIVKPYFFTSQYANSTQKAS
ncbi:hypothetical protein ACFQ5N_02130 [Lutibacter holmesii]|uniref:Uncharacterized protein n=1 Tax=Lutibacter holmesii TaxID=1137985 RepID=A0ABW3WKG9_9FLAO